MNFLELLNQRIDEATIKPIVGTIKEKVVVTTDDGDGVTYVVEPLDGASLMYNVFTYNGSIGNVEPEEGSLVSLLLFDDQNCEIVNINEYKNNIVEANETMIVSGKDTIIRAETIVISNKDIPKEPDTLLLNFDKIQISNDTNNLKDILEQTIEQINQLTQVVTRFNTALVPLGVPTEAAALAQIITNLNTTKTNLNNLLS
jgi:hypothetical protein